MTTKKIQKAGFSKLSASVALYAAAITGILLVPVFYWLAELSLLLTIELVLLIMVVNATVVYTISYHLHHPRVEILERIYKNIARKKFEKYDEITTKHGDELSLLIKRSVRASNMVEKEFQRLNKIENYRKEFIGDISHELKTPIFAIQGFIETLIDGAIHDDEVNEEFLRKAMRNVNRLTYLTKDLMEISRLETGELKSEIRPLHLRGLILEVTESLQYKSQKEEVEVIVEKFDRNLQVRVDRNQIRQVFINLIENGIKYNKPGGSVTIGITKTSQEPDKVTVFVRDTGIGIDPKDIPRVTERFFRVDKSRSRDKGGTGLGLSIVKHIIEAHGETLWIESNDQGTTFFFTLTLTNQLLA
jgi:two-component system phosphate regulon sensor histidine kinase PhoR